MGVTATARLYSVSLSFADKIPSASNYTLVQAQEEPSKADTVLGLGLSSPNYKPTQGLSSSNYKPAQDLSNPTFEPTVSDILCGRGRGTFMHGGNTLYMSLLRKNVHRYASSTKRIQKTIVITSIISTLQNEGFRFIRKEVMSQRWYQLSQTAAYDRTAHAIRDLIRKKKKKSSPPKASRSQCSASVTNQHSPISISSISLLEIPKLNAVKAWSHAHKSAEASSIDVLASESRMEAFSVMLELPSSAKAETAVGAQSTSYAKKLDPLIQSPIFETLENENQKQPSSSLDIFFQLNSTDFDQILRAVDNEKNKNKEAPVNSSPML
jgi:hypothetical protein